MKKQRYDFSPLATAAYQYPVQSTGILGLSFFFFSLPADFLFPTETHWYLADLVWISPVRRESARVEAELVWVGANPETKKKKTTTTTTANWMRFDAQAVASLAHRRVGHECGGHFAASLHPSQRLELRTQNWARWDQSWVKKPCLQEHKQWHLPTLPLEPWKQIMDLLQLSISIHSKTNPISQIPWKT